MRAFRDQFSYLNKSEEHCIRRLTFTKEAVMEICQLLWPQLQSRAKIALPVAVKVTMALNFYGSGSFQASAGNMCTISQYVVHCCIRVVTDTLYEIRNRFITFPLDRDKQNERAQGLARIADFSMVQGAIDCTHIVLRAPHINSAVFVHMQLVCNHTYRIMEVDALYPGSSHNAFVMQQSNMPAIFHLARQVEGWLLGDKDYPLKWWLMTPVRNPHTRAEQAYIESYAVTCNIVEHTIGLLKQYFRCLDRSGGALQFSPERVGRFVVVCCMLHNLAIVRD
ncbi:putative nuclease HARBI1 [Heptranchias perlo]|uniref:putative nuclease HARBI1 n=1 Tax=Heptranchias perlo TaxID=212740 RepID=UPI00355991BF